MKNETGVEYIGWNKNSIGVSEDIRKGLKDAQVHHENDGTITLEFDTFLIQLTPDSWYLEDITGDKNVK